MRTLTVVVIALLGISAGCVRHARVSPRATEYGSCEGACEHYTDCRGKPATGLVKSCLRECQTIFVTDGEVDHEALAEFEELDCPEAVAFVEGDSGHAPGDGDGALRDGTAVTDRKR